MSTPTFKRISLEQFAGVLAAYPFTRTINSVHMHHTWQPDHAQFKGHESIVSMWRFHTEERKWRDIAQHITIDPDGYIWLGRNWNWPPASAAGHNGNDQFGPFMFEMIGNFDVGHDRFDGPQRETALDVIARVQHRFKLPTNTLVFHNAMSTKSCPGSSLNYAEILAEVEQRRASVETSEPPAKSRSLDRGPFPDEPDLAIAEAVQALSRVPTGPADPADAELSHSEQEGISTPAKTPNKIDTAREAARDSGPGAAMLAAMRPHLVNLSSGRFSGEGEAKTTAADVDAIFEEHLKKALGVAKEEKRKLRLVFYAHGGLVSESSGLQIAAKHIDWWKRNGVYPIYFIWETGLFETLGQLLKRAQQGAARGMGRDLFDFTSDPLIELAARALGGPRIWGGMKASAEHAVDPPSTSSPEGGGAHYVAMKLKEFCDASTGDVELHAVGHSAGSIFHSYFLPTCHELGVPTFMSAHFLAPAVRVDTFKDRLAPLVGAGKAVADLSLFTMMKDYEKDDNCAQVYRKSLLYLIFYALEDRRSTPILGLEESLRSDSELKQLFGLAGAASGRGSIVWSVTASDTGVAASTSRSHGGFDDDPPTMNSVVRRVLRKADADSIDEFPRARGVDAVSRPWTEEVDWPEELRPIAPPAQSLAAPPFSFASAAPRFDTPQSPSLRLSPGRGGGRRRALCIGINDYPNPEHRLAGCVADAQMWADTMTRLGFTTSMLLDAQATRGAIDRELHALIEDSRAGDVIVFQYAGHGTHVPDLNGDEEDGQDEAICPVDFADGALYIDDDVAAAFSKIPDGVNMTCFTDCCHSGSNTRFAVGLPLTNAPRANRDERKRYVVATQPIIDAHVNFRRRMGAGRAIGTGGTSLMRDVKFAACLDSEVAWESEGHGEFTLRATRLLNAGANALTNEQFLDQVTADFGVNTRQHPLLDCGRDFRSRALLQPFEQPGSAPASDPRASRLPGAVDGALLTSTLASIQQLLSQLAQR